MEGDVESRLNELEERLKEAEHQRDNYREVRACVCVCVGGGGG